MESRRQKKVAHLIQEAFSEIFLKSGSNYYGSAFVTITDVKMTPDLLVARIYISVMSAPKPELVLASLKKHASELRKQLGMKLRNNLRRVPELEFFLDDTMDVVLRLEKIFNEIKKPSSDQ